MLTLFPRIKPNPLPSLPPEPLEAKPVLVQHGADAAAAVRETSNDALHSEDAGVIAVPPAKAPPLSALETATAASSVTGSDLFAAFMSGMESAGSDPFVVEITAPPSPQAESGRELRESAAVILEPSEKPPESVPETNASQSQIAREGDTDPAVPGEPSARENPLDASPAPQLYIAAANIFDELDILHEAATLPVVPAALLAQEAELWPGPDRTEPGSLVQAAPEAGPESNPPNPAQEPLPTSDAQRKTLTEIATTLITPSVTSLNAVESAPVSADGSDPGENQAATPVPQPESRSIETASSETAPELEPPLPQQAEQARQESASEAPCSEAPPSSAAAPQEAVAVTAQALVEPVKKAAFGRQLPPKPKRAKGTFFGLARVPEPEAMEDSGEVQAYSSAAAQSHLDAIDDTFVAHAQLLLKGRERGRALDIGTGPGQIVIKLGYRLSLWKFIGVDRSAAMIEKARESLTTAGELAGRVEFRIADGNALDFPDKTFDLLVCNSVLHHIAQPQKLFTEIARVVKPGGAILLRDLRRPSRWGYRYHVWKHGKYYTGEMRRLFMASVMAAYTEEELQKLLASSTLGDVRIFRHRKTHIGFERPLVTPAERKR